MFIWTSGGTRPEQYQLINDLVDGKLVEIKESINLILVNSVG